MLLRVCFLFVRCCIKDRIDPVCLLVTLCARQGTNLFWFVCPELIFNIETIQKYALAPDYMKCRTRYVRLCLLSACSHEVETARTHPPDTPTNLLSSPSGFGRSKSERLRGSRRSVGDSGDGSLSPAQKKQSLKVGFPTSSFYGFLVYLRCLTMCNMYRYCV